MEENRFRDLVYKTTANVYKNLAIKIENIRIYFEAFGINEEIPNIGFTLNNKIVEIQHFFENQGVPFFEKISNDTAGNTNDCIREISHTGNAIREDLFSKVIKANSCLDDIFYACRNAVVSRNNRLKKERKLTNILHRAIFNRSKEKNAERVEHESFLNEEEQKMITNSLEMYVSMDDALFNYSVGDEIVKCIVSYFICENNYAQKEKINSDFLVQNFMSTYNDKFVPDLKQLGYGNITPKICEKLRDVSKKIENRMVKMDSIDYKMYEMNEIIGRNSDVPSNNVQDYQDER